MEYVVTGIALLAFAGFIVWRVRSKKKATSGTTTGTGGGGGRGGPGGNVNQV